MLHGVVRHRPSAYGDGAFLRLVQPGDQAHEAGLAAAGAPQNAHRSPAGNVDVHILQHPLRAGFTVFEKHMVKVDAAVLHGGVRFGAVVGDGRLLVQNLHDPLGAGDGPGHHHEHHGNHHQGHQDLGDIGEEGGQIAHRQRPGVDHFAAEPHDGDDGAVNHQHHHRHIDDHHAEGPHGAFFQIAVALGELLLLMVLPDEGLHHPDAGEVLLHHKVQGVRPLLEGPEQRPRFGEDQDDDDQQQGDHHQKYVAQVTAQPDGQHQCRHQHHRGPYQQPHPHHQRHLHIVDVIGQPGHKGRGRELLDVGKGKILNVFIFCPPQLRTETLSGNGRRCRSPQSEAQGDDSHPHHEKALLQNVILIRRFNADIHNIRHHQRDQQFKNSLGCAAQNAHRDPFGIGPCVWPEFFQHVVRSSSKFSMTRYKSSRRASVSSSRSPLTMTASAS